MKTGKWHQELLRFLDIKTTFLIEGNVYDLNAYPTKLENQEIRWDMVMLDNYLFKFLSEQGYDTIVFYNHIDGFYNEFSETHLQSFLSLVNQKCEKNSKNFPVEQDCAADMIREASQNKTSSVAVIMMLSSRYIGSASRLTETERNFYTKILMTSLKKTQIKKEDKFINNSIFLICEKANDIPAWIYIDNPLVKTLTIQYPDKSARRNFIDTQLRFFTGDEVYSEEEITRYKDLFVDLTDGFQNLELNALKLLCRKEKISISYIKDAINMYKYGLKENPWNDIPREKLERAEKYIKSRIKGQPHAVVQTLDVIKRAACNMAGIQHSSGSKPKGILFFAGPTGTGKTELAKTLASLLFGDDNACIRFDMSEFQQTQSDQKLLGAPPGYVGYEAGGQLTNAVKEKPFSILLFDEIEKAHPSIFDKFLQILEDGRMTDGKGETVYFSECIIIFTSNLGIYDIDNMGNRKLNVNLSMNYNELSEKLVTSIKNYFKLQLGRPEILNRIGDNFVVFDFIRENSAREILSSQIEKITNNIKEQKNITVTLSEDALGFLLKKSFGNLENGGRGIGNIIEKNLINPLSRLFFDNALENKKVIINSISEDDGVTTLNTTIE